MTTPPGAESAPAQAATTIRIDKTLMDRLNVAALVCDTPAVAIIRTALDEHLTALEKSSPYKRRRADLIIATTPVEAKPPARRTKTADPTTEPENT